MHAGSFHVSVIHRTPTWTTGYLTCACDHPYARAYTHTGVGHTDSESAQHVLTEMKLSQFVFPGAPDGVRTSGLWISRPTLYQLSPGIGTSQSDLILTTYIEATAFTENPADPSCTVTTIETTACHACDHRVLITSIEATAWLFTR